MSHDAFVDSCVFIAYAADFEVHHSSCITFFEQTECEKYTSESVEGELTRKVRRRNDLYRDYIGFLARGEAEYRPSIYINKNDQRHLKDLIRTLSTIPAHDQLTFLRQFGKILKIRIDKAKGFISEVIPRNDNSYFKAIINTVIANEDDSWILNDAIHWSLSKSNAIFVTLDGEIYGQREKLIRKVIDFKSLTEAPIQIVHVGLLFQSQ